ncbi:hypothetical protein [Cloacibacillus sp. An23]|uniref:hypothetical protein n=1 Tax=Cloacibacillus sp. An23 TaxID=1965591 RepID=UPI000B39AC8C|nr:hypothetical protein [Cloacibacillus sp. An23]OUO93695.1 hypothetical protein B5F39_05795 [Cloacibacillus sp. An23]
MQEKVWAVVCQGEDGVGSVLVFDSETDARHFADEMNAGGKGTHKVFETSVHRRQEKEAALAHIELPEFSAKCIECLVDVASIPEEEKDAAAKYLEEHRGEIQRNAEEIVDGYIKKALTDFFDEDRVIHG